MRNYRGRIVIDGSSLARGRGGSQTAADDYERDVQAVLDAIDLGPCWVGTILLDEIDANQGGHVVRIVPRPDAAGDEGDDDAETDADTPIEAVPPGQIAYSNQGRPIPGVRGRGHGSNVHIHFSPGQLAIPIGAFQAMGRAADDLLVHELVHAVRQVQANWNTIATEDPTYDNEEEWLAILIANIYMSERSDYPLRANHHRYSALADDHATSGGFLDDMRNVRLMEKMSSANAHWFFRIATLALAQPDATDYEDEDTPNPSAWQRVPRDPRFLAMIAASAGISGPAAPGTFNPIRLYRDKSKTFIVREFSKPLIDALKGR